MKFSQAITKAPIPFDVQAGRERAVRFSEFDPSFQNLMAGVAGCSPYLAGLIDQNDGFVRELADGTADTVFEDLLTDLEDLSPGDQKSGFRIAKARAALLIALADLAGIWELEQVTAALTRFAQTCLGVGLRSLVAQNIERGKLPGMTPADIDDAGGMCILAMGKMGAYELNYSSDIDLICLFDESRFSADDYGDARAGFVRITRALMALMSDVTGDGYVFRTDLRLRPDASVMPVCIPMETAERYYESVGRNWERAAYIKARVCAGDLVAGAAFLDRLSPFIWRKHLDFASIQDAHDMRQRIRDHKGFGRKMRLEGHDMKLGSGGIREIEFFTQTRQMIAGGRDTSLRTCGTVAGLEALANAGWITADLAGDLAASYREFRVVEHRLQMIGDAQTHTLPGDQDGMRRLAAFLGQDDAEAWGAGLLDRLKAVADQTEGFFAPDGSEPKANSEVDAYLSAWRSVPALRSERAVELFRRVFPKILTLMKQASAPDDAIRGFEGFLRGLPAGVQLFSLFDANPPLMQLIVDICATSPALSEYLSRHSGVLDAVIGGDFFAAWPGAEALKSELDVVLSDCSDYEAKLDAARRWQKEWHFRIGVHHLRGLIPTDDAGAQYADLAQAVIAGLTPHVEAEFSRKYGPPPGRGAMVLAMGSLGAGLPSARSDLDLIVIYDADRVEMSAGPKPLLTRSYFSKLTQMLITALTAPTAEGRLYQVDMRLRPSGQSGPVATGLPAFEQYQRDEAWVWEHLALTRARGIYGAPELQEDVERIRRDVLARDRAGGAVLRETREMRDRLEAAGRTGSGYDVKQGKGGALDIELAAQALAVIAGTAARATEEQLQAAVEHDLLGADDADALAKAHRLYRQIIQATRLLTEGSFDASRLGEGAIRLLLRDCSAETLEELECRLNDARQGAAEVIKTLLAEGR